MRKIKILTALCFFCFSHSSLSEQNTPVELDPITAELSIEELYNLPIIDIATGYAVPLEKAPSVATVITAKDIKAMGALTLDDVLESVPGLHGQHSIIQAKKAYSIRGISTSYTPQVLILLNGNRISSDVASGTFPTTGVINIQNISRIEVIRGPGSAVYGADAFSGVINIVTKTARDIDGFAIGARGGSFSTQNIWGQYGGKIASDWDLAVNLEYMKQGEDTSRLIYSDAQTNLDALFGTSASLTPGYLNQKYESSTYNIHLSNSQWEFGIDGAAHRNTGQGPGIAQALNETNIGDMDHLLFTAKYDNNDWFENTRITSSVSYQIIDTQWYYNIFPAGNVSLIGSDGNLFTAPFNPVLFTDGVIGNPGRKTTTPAIDMTALYDGINKHKIRLNFGAKKEKLVANATQNFGPNVIDGTEGVVDGTLTDTTGTDSSYVLDGSRTIKYISLQDVWDFALDWSLTAGVRYDNYSDFGGTSNPRIALVWTPRADLTTKLLYGRAFRAPSFNELYAQNNPVGIGNPLLNSETIDTYELAFSYEPFSTLTTDLSVYHFKTKNMIDYIDNGDDTKTAQNFHHLKGRGIELEGKWKINKQLSLMANYAYQKTTNERTNIQQPYIPKQQFYLDARWNITEDWLASAQLSWIGDRKREADDNRDDIDDYTLVNMTLRRKNIAKYWELAASLKNVFNEDVREPSDGTIPDDYPMNERSIFLELSYQLSNK